MAIDYPIEPDWKLIFGNWQFARLRGFKIDKPNNRIIVVFVPDPHMRYAHQIPDSDYDQVNWVIKREYPYDYAHNVNPDAKSNTWVLLCDYDGKPCNPFDSINTTLLARAEIYRRELEVWKNDAQTRFIQLNRAVVHPEEFKTKFLVELEKQSNILRPSIKIGGDENKDSGGEKNG